MGDSRTKPSETEDPFAVAEKEMQMNGGVGGSLVGEPRWRENSGEEGSNRSVRGDRGGIREEGRGWLIREKKYGARNDEYKIRKRWVVNG